MRQGDRDVAAGAIDLQADPWLSRQLSSDAFHLIVSGSPDPTAIAGRLPDGHSFVDVKHPVRDPAGLLALIEAGFRLIDTQVSLDLESPFPSESTDGRVRFATPDDEGAVARVAFSSFSLSRFHLDPLVPGDIANKLKESWARNFFNGSRGDHMIVAETPGGVGGFLQLVRKDTTLVIDLVAVEVDHRGKGLARALIDFAVTECDPDRMTVGTQICNVPSLRLYERLGFRIADASYVLHRHS